MGAIAQAASHRQLKQFGINSWNDLLEATFGEINIRGVVYVGEEGLAVAQAELREFRKKHKRLPTNRDEGMGVVEAAARRGFWKSQGITTWNELLERTFGDINKGKYIGEQGLVLAQNFLREFKTKNKRLPRSKDKGMRGITHAIARREWMPQGIITWNDLLEATFNELNVKKYFGKSGLQRAMEELLDFEKMN